MGIGVNLKELPMAKVGTISPIKQIMIVKDYTA